MGVKFGLPPIAPSNARLFILGSLPGDQSLAQQRYYAHPTNQFWRLVGRTIGEEIHRLSYEERLERLSAHRIGLWDVIASASRRGSLDQAMREIEHNRVDQLLDAYPDVRAIAFNGAAAATIGRKLFIDAAADLVMVDLPSSSAANTRSLEEKARSWTDLARFL